MARTHEPPIARPHWAFFLDVDGTLVDIAETPDDVVVASETVRVLDRLRRRFAHAVALVSGRPIDELDRLFAPLRLAAAGLHGLERRTAAGARERTQVDASVLEAARARIGDIERRLPGVLLEDKGASLALHYRRAPEREAEVLAAGRSAVERSGGHLRLLIGKMVAELRPLGPDKGDVVEAFMAEPPFAGRVPVFVGDDVTDEDGFRAIARLGGHGIRVGGSEPTRADFRVPDVAALRTWLQQAAQGDDDD